VSKIYDEFTNVYMRGLEDGLELARKHPDSIDNFMHNIRDRRSKRIKMQYCNSTSNHVHGDAHQDTPVEEISDTPELGP
jgi:hypothetical protein